MDLREYEDQLKRYEELIEQATNSEFKDSLIRTRANLYKQYQLEQERCLAKRQKKLQDKIEKKGYSYVEWEAWARSLYPITKEGTKYIVTSNAANWAEGKHWVVDSQIEALERIEKNVDTKEYDRSRGHASGKNDMIS